MPNLLPPQEIRNIEGFLRDAKQRYWWIHTLQSLTSVGIVLLLVSAALALCSLLVTTLPLQRQLWLVTLGLSACYLAFAQWRIWRSTRDETIARQIEQWEPRAHGLLTALDLARAMPALDKRPLYSPLLAKARIQQVSTSISPIRRATHAIVPQRTLEHRAYALFALGALFFGALTFYPYQVSSLLHGLFYAPTRFATTQPPHQHGELMVGDLSVTTTPPSYTNLPSRTIPNSDGNISALKGSIIQLRARAVYPVAHAELLLNNQQRVKLTVGADKRALSGKFTLLKTGFYRFQLTDTKENKNLGMARTLHLQPDHYPKVKLTKQEDDDKTATKVKEYKQRDLVPIAYKFSDDFGISRISLLYRNLSKNQKKPTVQVLRNFETPPRKGKGRMRWNLAATSLAPGDRISYQIEVLDNDTISGPKRTRSQARTIKIYSPLENHDKLLAAQEKLLGKMTHVLGDLLEHPKILKDPERLLKLHLKTLHQRGSQLLYSFRSLLPRIAKDPLTKPYALITLRNLQLRYQLRHTQRQPLYYRQRYDQLPFPRPRYKRQLASETPPQEDDLYAFTLLLNRQRLDLLQHLARKLSKAQNRLSDLLDQYRRTRSEAVRKELLQEMRRIERLIRQIMKRMQRLSRQIPDEYLNMQAFRNRSSLRTVNRMRKLIEQGKIEEAAKELARLARQVERMASEMERYAKRAGGRAVSQLQHTLKKMVDDLHQLEQKQKRLSQRTQRVQRQVAKRMQQALKKKLQSLIKQQQSRLAKLKVHLTKSKKAAVPFSRLYRYHITYGTLESIIREFGQLLKEPDIYEALQTIRRFRRRSARLDFSLRNQQRNINMMLRFQGRYASSYFRKRLPAVRTARSELSKAIKIARRIEQDLERFFPSPQKYITQKDSQRLRQYQRLQKQLRRETQEIRKTMQRIGQRLPIFKPQMKQSLRQAIRQMRNSGQRLKHNQPRQAHGHQQRAVARLQRLRRQLQKSMQSQQQRQGKGGQKSKGNRQARGYGRRNAHDVKIPKASSHKPPKAWRQDILEAMKEKLPHRYRESVRRYYEKLVK